jgi:sporulation protein YlmC with PRC-barrel domain
MKRSLNELIGYSIETKDAIKGSVKDFLFNGETWMIDYLEADLGIIFPGKKVLIPKELLNEPHWTSQHFPVNLSKSDIENCPPLESHLPVSKKYEQALMEYYKANNSWIPGYIHPFGSPAITYSPESFKVPADVLDEKDLDTVLRSFKEIKGYHIQASDLEIGHVDDVIIDDSDWKMIYLVIDTSNWMPLSKKVLINTLWINDISYVNQKIEVDLQSETIKSAPEFDYSMPVNEKYEKQLYDYYGRPVGQVS